ncbi:hypothetical protein Tsubulata_036876 [Turnera subulata]|uniref:Uncharacterized protein n=1 Tax=Turnera subulata TaxID=218843 RepID=A0A9Q0JHM7_9ROSI|nr:hypothetical protein Tsubulata_036876 [Turnera subulata]
MEKLTKSILGFSNCNISRGDFLTLGAAIEELVFQNATVLNHSIIANELNSVADEPNTPLQCSCHPNYSLF